jgi:formylglycine-generating enzyme required for sulfatase activity
MPNVELLPERIRSKIRVAESGCWEWTASRHHQSGYGSVFWNGKACAAHRVVYELLVETIPPELVSDHLCRNHWCVNPEHIDPCTTQVNTLRGIGPSATHARKTHCIHGHSLAGENIYVDPKGRRCCKQCRQRVDRERYRRLEIRRRNRGAQHG